MSSFVESILAHKALVITLSVGSVAMFVGSLLAVPWMIARAPRDFFTRSSDDLSQRGSVARKVAKNCFGAALVIMGVLMLLLPGQGILTLLAGLALMDIPGKHALLVRMAKRESVMKALNYCRARAKREPFDPPQ